MPRLVIKYDDINHVSHIKEAVRIWEEERPPADSLKLHFQEEGRSVVIYNKGASDSIILTLRRG